MPILTGKLVSGPQLGPNENISARTGWIVMKLCKLIHCPQSLLDLVFLRRLYTLFNIAKLHYLTMSHQKKCFWTKGLMRCEYKWIWPWSARKCKCTPPVEGRWQFREADTLLTCRRLPLICRPRVPSLEPVVSFCFCSQDTLFDSKHLF